MYTSEEGVSCFACQRLNLSKEAFLWDAPSSLTQKASTMVTRAIHTLSEDGRDKHDRMHPPSYYEEEIAEDIKDAEMGLSNRVNLNSQGWTREHAQSCALCRLIEPCLSNLGPDDQIRAMEDTVKNIVSVRWKKSYVSSFKDMQRAKNDPFANSVRRYLALTINSKETGIILVPVASDMPSPWTFGKLLTDPDGLADFSLLRGWIDACEHWHRTSCGATMPTKREAFPFRLIDVIENCVVRRDVKCRYLALSYQWGQCNNILATKANIAHLEGKGSLLENKCPMPTTIRDAMLLTRHLGERCLWVDAICIVQDDVENKKDAIANMDAVYNHALLTIVAASGHDANAGLPGVRQGTRTFHQQPVLLEPGFRMIAVGKGVEAMNDSVYSTRAWT